MAAISREDAAAALREVERTQSRGSEARAYRIASPFLILWGIVWMVGYIGSGLISPEDIWKLWLAADLAGFAGTALIAVAGRNSPAQRGRGVGWKGFGAGVVIAAFMAATYFVLQPATTQQYEIFPALVMALVYSIIGVWTFRRFLLIGAAVFILVMVGVVMFEPWINYWIGAVGGGALVLGGLWLKKA